MFKGNVAVLDIGSSKITALVGGRGVNRTFSVKAVKSVSYSGYDSGAFFDTEELKETVCGAISSVTQNCGKKISELYVGVPGEFVLVKTQSRLKAYSKRRKIKSKDISQLLSSSYEGAVHGYKIIKSAPMYFKISGHAKTVNPENQLAESLEAFISYFFCDLSFINVLSGILADAGIRSVRFLPVSLCEAIYLIPPELRDFKVFLADIGYISSTVSEVCGNAIAFQKSFSRGCGHITAYLCEALDTDFDLAEILLQKSNLSYNLKNKPDYEIFYNDELLKFPAELVNSVIEYGLDEICEYLAASIEASQSAVLSMLITGGGIYDIRGALEHISRRLNINIENCAPTLAYFNKPAHSSVIGLLDAALSEKENLR